MRTRGGILPVAFALALFSAACNAPVPDPFPPGGFDAANAEVAGVVVLGAEIDAVRARLGAAPIVEAREGKRRLLCYRSSLHSDSTVLIFEADAQGEGRTITGFRIVRSAGLAANSGCVPSAEVHARLATRGGLRLGLLRADVEARLGPPVAAEGGDLFYRYAYDDGAYDLLDVSLADGAVYSITLRRGSPIGNAP